MSHAEKKYIEIDAEVLHQLIAEGKIKLMVQAEEQLDGKTGRVVAEVAKDVASGLIINTLFSPLGMKLAGVAAVGLAIPVVSVATAYALLSLFGEPTDDPPGLTLDPHDAFGL